MLRLRRDDPPTSSAPPPLASEDVPAPRALVVITGTVVVLSVIAASSWPYGWLLITLAGLLFGYVYPRRAWLAAPLVVTGGILILIAERQRLIAAGDGAQAGELLLWAPYVLLVGAGLTLAAALVGRHLARVRPVRGSIVAALVLLAAGLMAVGSVPAFGQLAEDLRHDPGPAATFVDANLEQALRDHLHRPSGAVPTGALAGIEVLRAESRGITDLTGIEHAEGLRVLVLTENRVADLAALGGLTELRCLLAAGNEVRDLGPLVELVEAGGLAPGSCGEAGGPDGPPPPEEEGVTEIDFCTGEPVRDRSDGPVIDLRFNPLDLDDPQVAEALDVLRGHAEVFVGDDPDGPPLWVVTARHAGGGEDSQLVCSLPR